MLEKFKTKELVVCALFGAITFLFMFILGAGLIAVTGIPTSGGILNALVAIFLVTVGTKIIGKFGTATIMFTIIGTLAIPTIILGPPGIYKIAMLFLIGFIYDLIIVLLKKSKFGYIFAGAVSVMLSVIFIYVSLILLGLPGADKLQPMLVTFSAIYAVLGGIGAYLGLWIYDKKLKNKAFVRQMRGE